MCGWGCNAGIALGGGCALNVKTNQRIADAFGLRVHVRRPSAAKRKTTGGGRAVPVLQRGGCNSEAATWLATTWRQVPSAPNDAGLAVGALLIVLPPPPGGRLGRLRWGRTHARAGGPAVVRGRF